MRVARSGIGVSGIWSYLGIWDLGSGAMLDGLEGHTSDELTTLCCIGISLLFLVLGCCWPCLPITFRTSNIRQRMKRHVFQV